MELAHILSHNWYHSSEYVQEVMIDWAIELMKTQENPYCNEYCEKKQKRDCKLITDFFNEQNSPKTCKRLQEV